MKLKVLIALGAFLLAGCGSPADEVKPTPAADDGTIRTISSGETIGFIGEEGVMTWRGLPFAAPPVGELRWRAPRDPAPWEGRRDARDYASICPQLINPFNASEGGKIGQLQGSEDCLYLNVYAPAGAGAGAPLPVMVWIHGGGNVWGSAKQFDPSSLVANENVIVVSVQYRLGPVGWFASEAIRNAAETADDASANFGTLDLVQALKWVKQNIAAFGGDPDLVTIFGESAGGQNVATLLASPLAKGLFQRAIIQSGLFDSTPLAKAESGTDAENPASKIAERTGAATAGALRALSLEALYGAYQLDEFGYLNFPNVINDGVALPLEGLRAALATPGGFNSVPVISGTNRDEMKLFQVVDPRLVTNWFGVLPVAKDQKFYDRLSYYQSRLWRIRSVDEPLSAMAAAGNDDLYAYRFDWDEGGRFLIADLKKLLGASHGMEIPFVFDRFELLGRLDPVMFEKKTSKDREKLARAMGGYWAAFAKGGAPGAAGGPDWPRWSDKGGSLMRLDTGEGAPSPLVGADSIDALIADLKSDAALNPDQRRIVAGALSVWLPGRAADFEAAAK
ncbi:MAG: carboxylesterase family protein [Pseudomonadota bacterium]